MLEPMVVAHEAPRLPRALRAACDRLAQDLRPGESLRLDCLGAPEFHLSRGRLPAQDSDRSGYSAAWVLAGGGYIAQGARFVRAGLGSIVLFDCGYPHKLFTRAPWTLTVRLLPGDLPRAGPLLTNLLDSASAIWRRRHWHLAREAV